MLNTWVSFKVFITSNRITEVMTESLQHQQIELSPELQEINFNYSVLWFRASDSVAMIPTKGESFDSEEVQRKRFYVINSLLLVVLLSGVVLFILAKTLSRDFQLYGVLEEEMEEVESGWKRLHADVFRFPKKQFLFCAITGCGFHILLVAFLIFVLFCITHLTEEMNTIINSVLWVFEISVPVCGFMSASLYRKFEGENTFRNTLLTYCLLTLPFFFVCLTINLAASKHHVTYAISWGTFFTYSLLFMGTTFPLNLFGANVGKRFSGPFDAPTRTKIIPRAIPSLPWYRRTLTHLIVGGLLPFMAIYIELYFTLARLWGTQSPTPFTVYFMMYIVLIVVTASVNVALTYDTLSAENHNWWWPSALCGGSAAVFVFLYCVVFLFTRTQIREGFHLVMYFGYTFFLCHCIFLTMATVGFYASLLFVKQIYRYIKSD
ncbi:putative phagocytic receptor 1b [Trypanosoma conorhini]|uniref:Transmembrane 9 superfamily member n=1 Tax=Trypanosoma conorhini TaxID=83891 RepID=A0A422MSF5_9TRYP|nr:putative phagocytic receptor 1b [Trypanosoma conorhini]RNE96131.1 putative phagocytic receptor 1b [Trypanosoma conorhini]